MSKKAAKLLLPLLASALVLAGCTSGGTAAPSAAPASDSQLNKVIKAGTVRVAVLPDYPPFGVQNASGQLEGYEIDIAKKLAEALGVKVELVSTDGAGRLPLLKSNRVDVNISAFTSTNERAKAVAFTTPYAAAGAMVLFRKSDPVTSYADLAGKKVSVARGSTNDTLMTKYYPKTEVVRFESIADAIAAMKAGKVDAVVEGQFTVKQQEAKDPAQQALDAPPLRPSLISMGVLQGDALWLDYLNNFIRNLTASGDNQDIYKKWFGADLPDVVK